MSTRRPAATPRPAAPENPTSLQASRWRLPSAGEYSFKLEMNKLSIPSPQGGPATLSITETGGATFIGSNANCQIFNKKMVCKD